MRQAAQVGLATLDRQDGVGWALTGVDPEGCGLRRGAARARLWFDQPVRDAEGARVELARLARRARAEAAEA